MDIPCSKRSTFIIQILNTQNSTWQGSVTWANSKKTENFRSALELIKLLDSAVDDPAEDSTEQPTV